VAIAYQHVRENPVPPSRLDPEIPTWADSIVLRAMAKDPGERYQSAAEMRTDIQRALSGVPVAAPRGVGYTAATQRMGGSATMAAGPTRAIPGYEYGPEEEGYTEGGGGGGRRRTWLFWALGALLVLAVLGGVAYAFFGGSGGVAVPQVTGLPQHQAVEQVKKAGLDPKVVDRSSSSVKKGIVIGTSPANGNLVAKGTTVTLTVSSGLPKVKVPSVLHESSASARNTLQNAGFQVKEMTDQNSTASPNTVVGQNPSAGTVVNQGATVTISVSPGGSTVPNVVNQQLAVAEGQLANEGFTDIVVLHVSNPGLSNGTVVNQSPSAGQTVPTSTQITLTVVQNQAPPTPTPTHSTPTPSPSATPSPSTGSGNGNGASKSH
jgi:serine/threonine-protein kinase